MSKLHNITLQITITIYVKILNHIAHLKVFTGLTMHILQLNSWWLSMLLDTRPFSSELTILNQWTLTCTALTTSIHLTSPHGHLLITGEGWTIKPRLRPKMGFMNLLTGRGRWFTWGGWSGMCLRLQWVHSQSKLYIPQHKCTTNLTTLSWGKEISISKSFTFSINFTLFKQYPLIQSLPTHAISTSHSLSWLLQ